MEKSAYRATLNRAMMVCMLLLFSPTVLAYLDPSTGSMVVSVLVGVFASVALAVKTYWYKIKFFFKRSGKSTTEGSNESSTER
jgi:amino acid permease